MAVTVSLNLNLNDGVTLRELREFVDEAERIGADPDNDIREFDQHDELVGLEAVGVRGTTPADA